MWYDLMWCGVGAAATALSFIMALWWVIKVKLRINMKAASSMVSGLRGGNKPSKIEWKEFNGPEYWSQYTTPDE